MGVRPQASWGLVVCYIDIIIILLIFLVMPVYLAILATYDIKQKREIYLTFEIINNIIQYSK